MIDMASVYADRFKDNSDALRAAVMGQSPDPKLDPYTALNALKLIKESQRMAMAGQAQQPTSSPSILAENIAPSAPPQGLAGMVPMGAPTGQMPQGMPPQGMLPQGMPPQGMPQQTMQAASGGLANMYTPEEDYAEGGIVAFQDRGYVDPAYTASSAGAVAAYPGSSGNAAMNESESDGEGMSLENLAFTSKGDPDTYAALAKIYPGAIASLGNVRETEIKPETLRKIGTDEIEAYRAAMGPNEAMDTLGADIAARKKESGRNLEEGKGVALLKAAFAVTQGNNWVRAFAGAGAAFGDEYNRALRADKEEKRSIAAAEFNMADAKRKENLGLFKEGRAAEGRYVAAVKAADKAKLDKAKAYADAIKGGMNATKPLRSAFSGAGASKEPKLNEQYSAAEVAYEMNPTEENRKRVVALRRSVDRVKTTESGPGKLGAQESQIFVGAAKDASAEARKRLYTDPVMRSNDTAAINRRYRELYAESIQGKFPKAALSELLSQMPAEELPAGGKAPAPAASAKALPMPASQDQLKVNQLYNTNRGLAIWNGTAFVPQ